MAGDTDVRMKTFSVVCASCLIGAASLRAGSATWRMDPVSNDWNNAADWLPNTVPNGPSDTATFDVSNTTTVSVANGIIEVADIVFNPGASAFTITDDSRTGMQLTVSGLGIINNSGILQNFTFENGTVFFTGAATAGSGTTFYGHGQFQDNASAAEASFILDDDDDMVFFGDHSTAGNASFSVLAGHVEFFQSASAGTGAYVVDSTAGNFSERDPSHMTFNDNATAGSGSFTVNGSDSLPTSIGFTDNTTAGNAAFTTNGAPADAVYGYGGYVIFTSHSSLGTSAERAIIINNGTASKDFYAPAETSFRENSTAAQATLIANGSEPGGQGGRITFSSGGDGGEARVELFGNGNVDLSGGNLVVSIGSLEGNGIVFLGFAELEVGTNNASTRFSGGIRDGGLYGGSGGSFSKVGTGTLTLAGVSTYTGGTIVSAGFLRVANTRGSATGTGPVQLDAGTLGGSGIISGAVTVGSGSGSSAFLAPGTGAATLTLQSSLTFKGDGTYTWRVRTTSVTADRVIANGVTIESGAQFKPFPKGNAQLPLGTSFIAISNSAATPISGTFSNLHDGSTVTVGINKFQADYQGGDGNDLTLTVVP